ncbi:hypothetical protein V8F33_012532 [Rhypophila sp. PSN 637]
MLALTRQICGLICLALLGTGESKFIFPPDGGPPGTIVDDSHLEFAIGSTIHLKWITDSTTPVTLIAYQGPRDPERDFWNITLLDQARVPVPMEYDWTVSSLNPNYPTEPIHFLLWTGFEATSFNSDFVRITPSTTSSGSSTSTSSSKEPSSTTSTSSQPSSSPSTSSAGGEEALKVGLGVGISLAFVLGGLLGYFLFRRRTSQRKASSPRTADRESPKDVADVAKGEPVKDVHEIHGDEANRSRRHEASGAEIYEAP